MNKVLTSLAKIVCAFAFVAMVTPAKSHAQTLEYALQRALLQSIRIAPSASLERVLLQSLLTTVSNASQQQIACTYIENLAAYTSTSTIVSCFQRYDGCQDAYIWAQSYYGANCH
ncbi:MAG: hypothetical protein KDD69_02000 [Bdellovibrionales bacterium]|nr:hypothetical protein [Bdellovibrionales bacterium]